MDGPERRRVGLMLPSAEKPVLYAGRHEQLHHAMRVLSSSTIRVKREP